MGAESTFTTCSKGLTSKIKLEIKKKIRDWTKDIKWNERKELINPTGSWGTDEQIKDHQVSKKCL